jgi:hypothetical protein
VSAQARSSTVTRAITGRLQFHHLAPVLSSKISFCLLRRLELLLFVLLHFGFLFGKYTSLATVGSFAGTTLISYPLAMHSSANPFGPVRRSPLAHCRPMDPASLFLLTGGQATRQGRAGAPSPTPCSARAPCQIEDGILENKTRGLDTIGFIEASADGSACERKEGR